MKTGPIRLPFGHESPDARVAGLRAIVSHDEVVVERDAEPLFRADVASILLDVRLLEPLPVDVHERRSTPEADPDRLAREADDALDERATGPALGLRLRRRLEDDDVASLGIA